MSFNVLVFIRALQATVLEEMPPFPERESSLLAKLKKKKALAAGIAEEDIVEPKPAVNGQASPGDPPTPVSVPEPVPAILIGMPAPHLNRPPAVASGGLLVDVFETSSTTVHSSAPTTLSQGAEDNLRKYVRVDICHLHSLL